MIKLPAETAFRSGIKALIKNILNVWYNFEPTYGDGFCVYVCVRGCVCVRAWACVRACVFFLQPIERGYNYNRCSAWSRFELIDTCLLVGTYIYIYIHLVPYDTSSCDSTETEDNDVPDYWLHLLSDHWLRLPSDHWLHLPSDHWLRLPSDHWCCNV